MIEKVASAMGEGSAVGSSNPNVIYVGDIVRNTKTGEAMRVTTVEQVFEIHPDLWSDWLWESGA